MPQSIYVHLMHKPEKKFKSFLEENIDSRIEFSYGNQVKHPVRLNYLVTGRPDPILLNTYKSLKALIIPFAGIPEETQRTMADFPHIAVHNLHHNAIPTAENALALLLAAAKYIIPPHEALKKNDWRPRYQKNPSTLLSGKTALILGYGQIAKHICKYLFAMDMKVIAMRNSIDLENQDGFIDVHPSPALHDLLPKAQFLINTLPLTPKTEGMINQKEFSLLPRGAVVVNIGRGKVLDQRAFYKALKSGHLGAAAIDVWYTYPTDEKSKAYTEPSQFPFSELENVILSPHRGGGLHSDETEFLRMKHLAKMLNCAAEGEPLPNQVDLSRGY